MKTQFSAGYVPSLLKSIFLKQLVAIQCSLILTLHF